MFVRGRRDGKAMPIVPLSRARVRIAVICYLLAFVAAAVVYLLVSGWPGVVLGTALLAGSVFGGVTVWRAPKEP
jgi:hypothetical protein